MLSKMKAATTAAVDAYNGRHNNPSVMRLMYTRQFHGLMIQNTSSLQDR